MGLISRIRGSIGRAIGGQALNGAATRGVFDPDQIAFSAGYHHLKLLGANGSPRDWMEAFEENSRLQVPIRAIAEDLSVVKFAAVRRTVTSMVDGDFRDEPKPKSRLAKWMADPNPFFTFGQLVLLTSEYYDVNGIALWRSIDGEFGREYWPIPPSWVSRPPDKNFKFWSIDWFGESVNVPESEMVPFWRPKLSEPYREWAGLAQTVDNEVAIDRAMGEFLAYSFANEATPSVIVGMPSANPQDLEREQAKWTSDRTGPRKARKAVFINSDVTVKEFKSNHKELEFNEGRRLTRDLILQAYGVPPERAGVLENANRSTIDAADFQQQSKNVLPRLTYFVAVINKRIAPLFGQEILVFENPVKESLAERLQTAEKICRLGIGSNDEARKLLGLPPAPGKFGRYVPVPVNNVRWYDPETDTWIDPDPMPDAAAPTDGKEPPKFPLEVPDDDVKDVAATDDNEEPQDGPGRA
jgi:hypothetical protein